MQHPIFSHYFALLVALILLFMVAFNFLRRKKFSICRNAKGVGIGKSSLSTALIEASDDPSTLLSAPTRNCYDVFLSFRGLDTRKGFTDHLYIGLVDAGIHTFRDDNELHHGKEIGPNLFGAIKNSKILIPILSVNYGSSKWCLDELVQIMECKNNNKGCLVLPIFYKVEPTHVRHQIGNFGEAFHTCGRHFNLMILEKWKQALIKVSSLKGWEGNRYEGELVKLVVQRVLSELKKEFELFIPENLVGIDGHVEKVIKFVDNNYSATLFIGIHGMGGIGKTTLAKAIYNKLSDQFQYHSFIADIRESCQRKGLEYLQNQLISDILKQKNQVSNKDDGTKFISYMFKDKKVLILVDDVDDHDQLTTLVGNHNWFSSGSRILITTRNNSILDNVGVDYKYELKEMDKNHSMVLFSRHAFRMSSPPIEFKDLTHDVITTTGGLPLSLEVLGSFLCGKKSEFWRGTIDKLKRVPHKKVREKLRISYEELDYEQKQIFLDIACFFIGTDKSITSYMWDACGFFPKEGIEVLRFMSLIKIGDDRKLRMHDQLRDLGREIVREENQREPQYRSRLWDSKEVQKVFKENKGTEKIEAIDLSKGNSEGFNTIAERDGGIYTEKQFKNLTSLRFLHIEGAHLNGDFKNSIEGLRWLRWPNCPMNFEVNNFHVKELVVLELSISEINGEWEGWSSFMMAKKLKFLDLTLCCSLESTHFLSAFKNLEVLILNDCWSLQQIDSSIGDMEALIRLELRKCKSLMDLPAEIGKLKSLEQLCLRDIPALSTLPDSIGSLENLESLDISGTGIEELPNGIERLRKLRNLNASYCKNLGREMPESSMLCNLSSLQHLDVRGCSNLQLLPDLPSSLTFLGITCQSHKLPPLSHLTHLKELRVRECKFLECIQELPSALIKNSECSQLTNIRVSEVPQSLNTLFKLKILDVNDCDSIKILDVSQFIHLRTLSINLCKNLPEVQGLDKLKFLESLTVACCDSIEQLDLPKLEGLKILEVHECDNIVKIQGLDRLEFLERLYISWCTSIERLNLPNYGCLKTLYAKSCKKLVEIQGLDRMELLESLDIIGCTSIERLLLPKFGVLKTLYAGFCKKLSNLQGLNRLEFLEELYIQECTSIERLDLPKSGRLRILEAGGCKMGII
ncbi:hypothetical protein ACJRO7_021243 [Eucalyptus globulus]|uniref:TIR domain-containing protein n=1 Tax=Eucalyptus globulus TaxID=34317 RepID=A0ABD3KVV1_EUCGL